MLVISFKTATAEALYWLSHLLPWLTQSAAKLKIGEEFRSWQRRSLPARLSAQGLAESQPLVLSVAEDGRLWGRCYPHVTGKSADICHPHDWLPGGDFPVLQDAAGGPARKERINRETGDGAAAMKAGTVCVAARWCLVGNVAWWFCLQVFVTGLCRVGVDSPPARLQL